MPTKTLIKHREQVQQIKELIDSLHTQIIYLEMDNEQLRKDVLDLEEGRQKLLAKLEQYEPPRWG